MLGFDTIGNATLIAYDGRPVLACDPWTRGGAYFGSWRLAHDLPREQLRAIEDVPYVWFSHGHPDHLNGAALDGLSGKTILLADHEGARIQRDLTELGFTVRVLPDRKWVSLSKRVRVLSIADHNQDSILLADIGGRLVLDLNDAKDFGWGPFVRRVAARFEHSYLLRLDGYGDADMINLFDEEGRRIEPPAADRTPVGPNHAKFAALYGASTVIPFSSFHAYQREDSAWANAYTTPLEAHAEGFDAPGREILPAYVRVDCESGEATPIEVAEGPLDIRPAADFGDDWSEPLERDEQRRLVDYVRARRRLERHFGFVRFVVGGSETVVDLNPRLRATGITLEVPRGSLTAAIEHQVFDDLLIGNFMRTTLHGEAALYPHFTPIVAKHADNGGVFTRGEYARYRASYVRRAPLDTLRHLMESKSEDVFRRLVPSEGRVYERAKRFYWYLKG